MIERTTGYDMIVFHTLEGFQPLHAIYTKTFLPEIRKLLENDLLKIAPLYKHMRTCVLEPDEIALYDPEKNVLQY
jgi:molybdopterin-guanine dinucleotide biosynthesis protein A